MTSHENTFAISLNASIRNVNSVWKSIVALKEALDRKIPGAFKKNGLAPGSGNVASHDIASQPDDNSDLCLKWIWAYPVKTPTRGKPGLLGHLYCCVALTPSYEYANYESTFQPYIAFYFTHGKLDDELGADAYLDYDHPLSDDENKYTKIETIDLFPSKSLCQERAVVNDDHGKPEFWVYYPLNYITSTNIDTEVISPLIKAIKTISLRQ